MSGFLGGTPSFQSRVDASSTNIPSASTLELEDNLSNDISSMDFQNATGSDVSVYSGPDDNLILLCIVGGADGVINVLPRAPVGVSKGSRLSLKSASGSDISTGTFIINGWVS